MVKTDHKSSVSTWMSTCRTSLVAAFVDRSFQIDCVDSLYNRKVPISINIYRIEFQRFIPTVMTQVSIKDRWYEVSVDKLTFGAYRPRMHWK